MRGLFVLRNRIALLNHGEGDQRGCRRSELNRDGGALSGVVSAIGEIRRVEIDLFASELTGVESYAKVMRKFTRTLTRSERLSGEEAHTAVHRLLGGGGNVSGLMSEAARLTC